MMDLNGEVSKILKIENKGVDIRESKNMDTSKAKVENELTTTKKT
jgi:hypothetical protein